MELDFSQTWWIIAAGSLSPEAFPCRELAYFLGKAKGCTAPLPGDDAKTQRIIVLDCGANPRTSCPGGPRKLPRFSWRCSEDRIELYGENEAALLRAVYDFLSALGFSWVEAGEKGQRLPQGPRLSLKASGGSSKTKGLPATLILGHQVFLEQGLDYLVWAARQGYASVFFHITRDRLSMGAIPEASYDAQAEKLSALAAELGLAVELGGHLLSSFLPRDLLVSEPELYREQEGRRLSDYNLCPSSLRAHDLVRQAFSQWVKAHPEARVFHVWPDDLPLGGWCSCPKCREASAGISEEGRAAYEALLVMKELARCLKELRPDASLAFLSYHETEAVAQALDGGAELPANLDLLWAPRLRSWGKAVGDSGSKINTASFEAFRGAAKAWKAAGGGRVSIFEYYEDALLFKAAVPPLLSVMAGDIASYAEAAESIGILLTGGRLPLAPRPNVALFPGLCADIPGIKAAAIADTVESKLASFSAASYGKAGIQMLQYWKEVEAAWAIDLDIESGDCALVFADFSPKIVSQPPADWGDPHGASLDRLTARRGACEELFDHLRAAEAILAEEADRDETVAREKLEYAISDAVVELDCARIAVYHEKAAGSVAAAADIANLALSTAAAAYKSFRALPDPRQRREMSFLIFLYYELRLRLIRRENARSALRRALDRARCACRLKREYSKLLRYCGRQDSALE